VKILHVSFTYYPDAVGGTEIYVKQLAACLAERGVTSAIAANGKCDAAYEHAGVAVHRMAVPPEDEIDKLYRAGNLNVVERFAQILAAEKPEVLHLHAFIREITGALIIEAKHRDIPIVYTYHTPTATCMRGTLLRWGDEVCDGKMEQEDCAACFLHGLGMNRWMSRAVAQAPAPLVNLGDRGLLPRRAATALRTCSVAAARHAAFRAMVADVNRIVAVAGWVRDLLIANGVQEDKISLCRHGVENRRRVSCWPARTCDGLKVVFLGRLTEAKGAHILMQAIRRAPELRLTLDLYGVVQDKAAEAYLKQLLRIARGDSRIRFHGAVASEQVPEVLRRADVLAVPSLWLETGPLVVLEAFAAGVPVMASDRGGMRELIDDEVNGWLVQAGSVNAWTQALRRLCADPEQATRVRGNIVPPRAMTVVAQEMLEIYRDVMAARPPKRESRLLTVKHAD